MSLAAGEWLPRLVLLAASPVNNVAGDVPQLCRCHHAHFLRCKPLRKSRRELRRRGDVRRSEAAQQKGLGGLRLCCRGGHGRFRRCRRRVGADSWRRRLLGVGRGSRRRLRQLLQWRLLLHRRRLLRRWRRLLLLLLNWWRLQGRQRPLLGLGLRRRLLLLP